MNLNNIRLENSYHVAVIPNDSATNKIWQFPDIPTLRDRKIVGIQAKLSSTDVNSAKSNYNVSISKQVAGTSGYITMIDTKGNAIIQNLPIIELVTTYTQFAATLADTVGNVRNITGLFVMKPTPIAFSKCFLSFPQAAGTANLCSLFNVFYI